MLIDEDPFVIGDLPPGALAASWRHGEAVAVHRIPPMRRGLSMLLLGPPADLAPLIAALVGTDAMTGVRGVTIERHNFEPVAAELRRAGAVLHEGHDWDWMWTSTPPPAPNSHHDTRNNDTRNRIHELDDTLDAAQIRRFYAAANPGAESQPGEGVAQLWLGIRDRSGLIAVGALHATPAGYPHLTGIAIDPAARGRGLGVALSAELTRRALGQPQPVGRPMSTLGMYAENDAARAVYTRLGYRVGRAWASRPITSPGVSHAVSSG